MPFVFRIEEPDCAPRVVTVDKPIAKIGKLDSSDLRLADPRVSRMHAVVEVNARGEVMVIDVGSLSGTSLNGAKVTKATLAVGDLFVVGGTRIVLEAAGRDPAPSRAVPPPIPMTETVTEQSAFPRGSVAPRASGDGTVAAASPADGDAGRDRGRARAVEIVALWGESVLAVHHLDDPQGGHLRRLTKCLLAGGFLASFLALIAFGNGVRVAARNHDRLNAWLASDGAPIDFKTERLSPIWDVLAAGGTLAALGLLAWGVARAQRERRPPCFRIGQGRRVEFPTEAVGCESVPLVAPSAEKDGFDVTRTPTMTGELVTAGQRTALHELPASFRLPSDARLRVLVGPTTFLVSSVSAPRRTAMAFGRIDGRAVRMGALSVVAHAILLLLFYLLPGESTGYASDFMDPDDRITVTAFMPAEAPKVPEPKSTDDQGGGASSPEAAAALQAGHAGVRGAKDAAERPSHGAVRQVADKPTMARGEPRSNPGTAGILGVLRQGPTFRQLEAVADYTSGFDAQDIRGAWQGPLAEARGWGMGVDGNGAGGGGTNLQSFGAARWGTIGSGRETGAGYVIGSGTGGGPGGRRPKAPVPPKIGEADTRDIDPSVLRRYVRRHAAELGYCFEKQLMVMPSLEGTVTARFSIDTTGRVIASSASGLDPNVDTCVADVIRRIQFPTGFVIDVKAYPFVFHREGAP